MRWLLLGKEGAMQLRLHLVQCHYVWLFSISGILQSAGAAGAPELLQELASSNGWLVADEMWPVH
jgi:hypothetical protein